MSNLFSKNHIRYLISTLIIILFYSLFIEPYWLCINKVDLPFKDLPTELNGLKIIHLTDFHLRQVSSYEKKVIEIANNTKADFIFLTGDFVENKKRLNDIYNLVSKLKAKKGIFAVQGNWDHWAGISGDIFKKELQQRGITLLNNEKVAIQDLGLNIVGIDDPFTRYDNLIKATNELNKENFTILLSHSPEIVARLDKFHPDLILAGHTHGGQIYLPIIGPLWTPGGQKKYLRGLYNVNGINLYVNRGVGTSIFPVRLLSRPEITIMTLNLGE